MLGWPLRHTFSPAVHEAAFEALGLEWVYLAWPVRPAALDAALEGLRALGCAGANVTMPHKETALSLLDELSSDARAIGAVNTIEFRGGQLVGHNTDVYGFIQLLECDAGVAAAGKHALVLGAGGAARAVVTALEQLGAESIDVAARDLDAATDVAALATTGRGLEWTDVADAAASAGIVVNATPVGTNGEELLVEVPWRAKQVVVDLVYDPPWTPLVAAARSGGAGAWGGLGMLVHQAAGALRLWTGLEPPLEAMSAAALRAGARRRP